MKQRNIVIFFVGLILLGISVFFVSGNMMTPYVSFHQARSQAGQYVQVIGRVDKTRPVVLNEGGFAFTILGKDGSRMNAVHKGPKPQNFDQTEQVVLLGRYIRKDEVFVADSILVKCPSKYRRKEIP
jgi:cytochrome c-type biogenesis protein CcmE